MLKVLGAVALVGGCGLVGLEVASAFIRRSRELEAFISSITLLQAEIAYRATPLPEALESVGSRVAGNVGTVFGAAADYLRSGEGISAGEAWQAALERWKGGMSLREEDWSILYALGHGLGNSGYREQVQQLELACAQLNHQYELAEQERVRNVRLWRNLGLLVGLGLVITLY